MTEELISIVVPVYNAEKFLNDTIQTVLAQTYPNWELLLVDDCSSDGSVSIIKKFAANDDRIHLLRNEKNSGAALTRNKGIEEAKGTYLCFLDADDLWEKEKLEKQLKFMKENHCAFSYTSYEFADSNGIPNGKKVIAKKTLTYKQALKNNIISTITVMFDLNKLDKNLIKMPNISYVEDTATWWRILRKGYVAYGVSELYSYYRRVSNTNSSNKLKTQKFLWQVYRQEEQLCITYALYCLCWKNVHAVLRRV